MRATRLLTILITLQARGRVTASMLASRLEVSKRTIYRDIDELSAAGIPIYADRGRSGGIALLEGFYSALVGLTARETEALLMAAAPTAAADLGLANEVSAARTKLLAAVSREPAESGMKIADRFHLDPLDWYRRSEPPEFLSTVAQCVWNSRRLAIYYKSWRATTRSVIEPLGLILKAGRWYLLAAGESLRAYRLDSILEAIATEQTFDRPQGFDLAASWNEYVHSFESSLRTVPVTLRANHAICDRLTHLDDAISLAFRTAVPDAHGWCHAVVHMESIERAVSTLLGLAGDIEVLAPEELVRELTKKALEVVNLYHRYAAENSTAESTLLSHRPSLST